MGKKQVCILMSSPRRKGNTARLLKPFTEEMEILGHDCSTIYLYDKRLQPCTACRCCQQDWSIFGCCLEDDMQLVFDQIMESELLILASPIYSWYCTPPMKTVLDRMVYGMNKYYGEKKGPSLWAGKRAALLTTCGYPPEKGADLWEEGVRRYCKHSQLQYAGMLAERHMGYQSDFMDTDKEERARAFARSLV